MTSAELLFVLWSLGFVLDEVASIAENGLAAYFSGIYNGNLIVHFRLNYSITC